jgi:hypothetical protein
MSYDLGYEGCASYWVTVNVTDFVLLSSRFSKTNLPESTVQVMVCGPAFRAADALGAMVLVLVVREGSEV